MMVALIISIYFIYWLPNTNSTNPINNIERSMILSFTFFSRRANTPYKNETITLPRRIIDTTEIIESSNDNE